MKGEMELVQDMEDSVERDADAYIRNLEVLLNGKSEALKSLGEELAGFRKYRQKVLNSSSSASSSTTSSTSSSGSNNNKNNNNNNITTINNNKINPQSQTRAPSVPSASALSRHR